MATTAAVRTFRRVYANPANPAATAEAAERLTAYALFWSYYTNSAFDDLARWESYRARNQLYRHIRPIYNPARRLVDFYSGIIYQGQWQTDADAMTAPDAAIPWQPETPPALLAAIAQLYQWSNWRSAKSLLIRYGAAVGDALAVVVDDTARRKSYIDVLWPGHVADIDLDPAGNVAGYTLEYAIDDGDGQAYTYRREVDKQTIRTYRDDRLHAYGDAPAEQANPYGFVPAAWINHTPTGSNRGDPALRGIGKIDELNNLASHALDQAHRIFEAPLLIAGENINMTGAGKSGPTVAAGASPTRSREEYRIATAASGARIETARLDPGEALEHIDRLLREVEADHPEITMYNQLRQMTQVTGPAADRLFGDVRTLVDEARTQYDQATIKVFQMAVAISGWRANSGAWGSLDRQQQKFLPFDLDSYRAGDLDLSIQSRPLIPPTREELIAIERAEGALEADRQYAATGATPQSRIADRLRQVAAGDQASPPAATPTPAPA